jgi:hypothetical protein
MRRLRLKPRSIIRYAKRTSYGHGEFEQAELRGGRLVYRALCFREDCKYKTKWHFNRVGAVRTVERHREVAGCDAAKPQKRKRNRNGNP